MYHLLSLHPLLTGDTEVKIYDEIMSINLAVRIKNIPIQFEPLKKIMALMLDVNPAKRLNINQVFNEIRLI